MVAPFTAFHPLTEQALDLYAPGAERWLLNEHPLAYHTLLAKLWADGDSFLIIEHDIEIRTGVVEELEACPEPYCCFPYAGPGGDLLVRSLGCTRFSGEFIAEHPSLMLDLEDRGMTETSPRHWRRMDAELAHYMQIRQIAPHMHQPPVLHHHAYRKGCGCGREHPDVIDPRGRQ